MSGVLIFKLLILSFSVLNALVLIVKGNKGQIRNYFLGWSLLFYGIYFLVFILWYQMGFILEQPHLMRTCSPMGFLAAPFFYFFIRNNCFDLKGLQKWDWLHFIPALLHAVELTPFYLLSEPEKRAIAQQVLSSPYQLNILARGIVHPVLVNSARIVLMIGYFITSSWILFKQKSIPYPTLTKSWTKNWLLVALFFIGGINLGYFAFRIAFFAGMAFETDLRLVQEYSSDMILFCISILSLYIQLNPELVFSRNLAQERPKERKHHRNQGSSKSEAGKYLRGVEQDVLVQKEDTTLDEQVMFQLAELFEKEHIYREQSLLVGDLAKRLGVSVRDLPLYFRHQFNSDFKTLVNDYRVCLARKKIEEGYLDDYTLEALGEHCGFSSRTTFFNTFKKKFGKSPNDYWKAFQENEGFDKKRSQL